MVPATRVPILLAEDEETDVYLFRLALQRAGLSTPFEVAPDGMVATQYLNGDAPYDDRGQYPLPSLLLLDLKMPRMDGFAVLEWLQARPDLKHLPVVVLTSSADDSDKKRALQLDASEYRIKPGKPKDLVNLLQDLHARWLSNRQNPAPASGVER